MASAKLLELWGELRSVLSGRSSLLDAILPPAAFLVVYGLAGARPAIWSALGLAGVIALLRLWRGQSLRFALGGLAGVGVAFLLSELLGRTEGFFLPSMVTGAGTALLAVVSILAGRPMVAWTSHLTRRWPRDWYWHPRVRPAYSEVTWLWALFFGLRVLLQLALFRAGQTGLLALTQLLTGWPALIVLLVISYLYGTWRLRRLGGPSVAEFRAGAEPPWQSQQRGF